MSVMSMRELGRWGRWGNMFFEYVALKAYAVEHDCELQIPDWPGKYLFGLSEPPVTANLPEYMEQYEKIDQCWTRPIPPHGDELVGHDFKGYGQWHTSWWTEPRRRTLRETIGTCPSHLPPEIGGPLQAALTGRLPSCPRTLVGIHIRKGDYGKLIFYLTPIKWYLDWLAEWWPQLKNPVLYLASEDPADADAFAAYDPWTQKRLGLSFSDHPYTAAFQRSRLARDQRTHNSIDMDFATDWLMLSHCQYLVTGNSTFSFSAGLVADITPRFFRASLPDGKIVEEDLWNTTPLRYERVENYPHLEGISLTSNPYWRG